LQLLQEALPERFHRAVPEIMLYLSEGFGNSTRIDYGTGHEMSFIMLMCCLFKIGALLEEDKVAAVTRIFNR
jgi:serine/threonine-protein phosphatase 2A activator